MNAATSAIPETEIRLSESRAFAKRVLRAALAHRAAWRVILSAILFEAGFGVLGPWVAAMAIDQALPNHAVRQLALVAAAVVVASLYNAWAGWTHQRVTIALQYHVEVAALRQTLEAILRAPFKEAQHADFGSTSQTMASASMSAKALVRVLVAAVSHGSAAIAAYLLLAASFPGVATATAAVVLVTALTAAAFSHAEAKCTERALAAASREEELLHALLAAAPAVRASGATDRLLGRWEALLEHHARAVTEQEAARISRDSVMEAGQHVLSLGTTGWFVYRALAQEVTIGQLLMGMMVVGSFARVVADMTQILLRFRAMRPHFQRVDTALASAHAEKPVVRAGVSGQEVRGGVVMERVWFRYEEGGPWVLGDYSASFPVGQVTRISAASGWGKTTILRLLAGLLEPARGTVRVLGHNPFRNRALVTYLPQQACLLEASILTNLCTLSGQPIERVLEVAKLTGLDTLLERLPMGVETPLSLNGGNLSAGQRQLLLLTAAFASRTPVVLLDEPTSQLDPALKAGIRWGELVAGRTVVLVEHDARTPG